MKRRKGKMRLIVGLENNEVADEITYSFPRSADHP